MSGKKQYTITKAKEVLQMLIDLRVHTNSLHKSATEELKLADNDIRASTFSKFRSRVNTYLINHYTFTRILESADCRKLFFSDFPPQLTKSLIRELYNDNRLDFFIKIFSLFEDAVTIILKSVLTDYKKLSKKQKFIPFIHKIGLLRRKINLQRDDFQFMEFCSKVRNSIHSNGFYFGPPYKYQKFRFENGKVINFVSEQNVINWARRLIDIFNFTIRNIDFPNCIQDPTMENP